MSNTILVVDDDEIVRDAVSFFLSQEGYTVVQTSSAKTAIEEMSSNSSVVLVIADIAMPEMSGIELLEHIKKYFPTIFVMMLTAHASIEGAVESLQKGAFDYVIKPFEFRDILSRIHKVLEHRKLSLENTYLQKELQNKYDFRKIIGRSEAIQHVFNTIEKVAESEGNVLITGASGSGKELVARAIHYNSTRKHKRFVAVNCGAIVDTLFESELFGHKKGSFTGAISDREGVIQSAEGGTLLLDEVSEMPFHLQVKLLRALEQREIFSVGSSVPIKIDIRVIASTNKNLLEEVTRNKFREDLFYRLNVVEIHLPTLNERSEDIPLLVEHFISLFRAKITPVIKGITKPALEMLLRYQWKGQVRELQNVIEHAMIFCDKEYIDVIHLPVHIQQSTTFSNGNGHEHCSEDILKKNVRNFERTYIMQTLRKHQFDKEKTAKELGISLSSLYRKMEELNIPLKQFS